MKLDKFDEKSVSIEDQRRSKEAEAAEQRIRDFQARLFAASIARERQNPDKPPSMADFNKAYRAYQRTYTTSDEVDHDWYGQTPSRSAIPGTLPDPSTLGKFLNQHFAEYLMNSYPLYMTPRK